MKLLDKQIDNVNNYLESYIDKLETNIPDRLLEAMRYSVFAGGKRLRPILLIETAKIFSNNICDAIPLACGIEMIHTYSLIHDDLPALDDDEYRRGKLTSHKVFGEDIAILAGDALLNYSYEIMIEHSLKLNNDILWNYVNALKEITICAGTKGMIRGQVADVLNENIQVDKELLDYININKTGALIRASVRSGALLYGCVGEKLNKITSFGENIGLAFQIVDDILDVIGDPDKIGKSTGSDEKNNKKTYVDYYGLIKSKEIVEELMNNALVCLSECGVNDSLLIDLTYFICKRDF